MFGFLARSRVVPLCDISGYSGLLHDHVGTRLAHDTTYASDGDLVTRNAGEAGAV